MCALPILPGTRVPDHRRHAVILFSRPSRSRGYRTDCYFWSLYWPRDCDEFRAVGKCGLDLNLAKHLGNTLHDIVAGEHVSARFHQRSEEHTSELQSLMRTSYAVFCLKKKKHKHKQNII